MIRMCNLNLLPGDVPFEHLFDDVRDGVYMEANRSWSIDDRRLNFQFGYADRLGDQEREARPHAQEPDLRRRHAGVLELVRRDRRRRVVVRVGHAELRQRASRCRPAAPRRRLRRPASATSRSGSAMDADARRALAARVLERSRADATEVIVTSEHRALTRFTHEFIHQNVDVDERIDARARDRRRTDRRRLDQRADDAALDAVVQRAAEIAALRAARSRPAPTLAARAGAAGAAGCLRRRDRRCDARRPRARRGRDLRAGAAQRLLVLRATSRPRRSGVTIATTAAPTRRSTAPSAAPT